MKANDTIPCGATATLKVTKQPKHGAVDLQNSGGFTYTPSTSPAQSDSFAYEVRCPNGLVTEAMVFLPGEGD